MTFDESTPVLDTETLESLKDLSDEDDDFLGELIEIFAEDAPERLSGIEAALGAQDVAALRMESHTLKSSAANLGAMRLKSVCAEIEAVSRAGGLEGVEALYGAACREFDIANDALVKAHAA